MMVDTTRAADIVAYSDDKLVQLFPLNLSTSQTQRQKSTKYLQTAQTSTCYHENPFNPFR